MPSTCRSRLLSPDSVDTEDLDPSDDEVTTRNKLTEGIQNISLFTGHDHFLGKSSGLMFLQTALDMKQEYVSPGEPINNGAAGPSGVREGERGQTGKPLMPSKRPLYWHEHPVGFRIRGLDNCTLMLEHSG